MAVPPLAQLIATASARLTPAERRIAEAVLADPTLLAFGTVSHLAAVVGTSRPSIVRFAATLGFDGFPDLQGHARDSVTREISRPADRIRQDGAVASTVRAAIERSIASVFETIADGRLAELGRKITGASSVWVLSGETSRAGAHALVSGLSIVRPGVHFVTDHTIGSQLGSASSQDVAIAIDFQRYRRSVVRAAEVLASDGVDIIAITDGPLSPLARLSESWYELDVPAVGPFDSSLSTVALAELIVAEVAAQLRRAATERIDRTEAMWAATDTFHSDHGQGG